MRALQVPHVSRGPQCSRLHQQRRHRVCKVRSQTALRTTNPSHCKLSRSTGVSALQAIQLEAAVTETSLGDFRVQVSPSPKAYLRAMWRCTHVQARALMWIFHSFGPLPTHLASLNTVTATQCICARKICLACFQVPVSQGPAAGRTLVVEPMTDNMVPEAAELLAEVFAESKGYGMYK